MWFLYLVLTPPADLPRITGAVEDPVEEADSEDDSVAVGDAEPDVDAEASDRREQRQQHDDKEDVGGGVEGVEVIEGLLCRQGCQIAKFDCAPRPPSRRNPSKGRDQILQCT